jgi:hypothetical protein
MAIKSKNVEVTIIEVKEGRIGFCLLGKTPMIHHRMSQKVMQQLLFPPEKKTAASKQSTLKHEPLREFRDSVYTSSDDNFPTLIYYPAGAFKKAISNAALDIPGATKSQIGRLCWVEGENVPIYGIPKLSMMVTRCSDIARTPDVRTRVIMPEWAAFIEVSYTKPMLKDQDIANLITMAGKTSGMGDYRPQKGSGNYGQFEPVEDKNPEFKRIMKMGRKAQIEAMDAAEPYDIESADLLSWFTEEVDRRGFKVAA